MSENEREDQEERCRPTGTKIIKKNTKLDSKQTSNVPCYQYKVTSFLSTDCELSTNPCSKNVYNLGPRTVVSPARVYGAEKLALKKAQENKLEFTET